MCNEWEEENGDLAFPCNLTMNMGSQGMELPRSTEEGPGAYGVAVVGISELCRWPLRIGNLCHVVWSGTLCVLLFYSHLNLNRSRLLIVGLKAPLAASFLLQNS